MTAFALMIDPMLQLEMEFAHRLDPQRLTRAFGLLLDAEPVLGCRFVPDRRRPYWERVPKEVRGGLDVTEDEREYSAFKLRSIPLHEGPMAKACLWRGGGGDRLVLKVRHDACDAGGTKEAAAVFADIYRRLARESTYAPSPNVAGSRSSLQVIRRLPWHAFPRIYWNYLSETWSNNIPPTTHSLCTSDGPRGEKTYIVRHMSADRVSRMVKWGQARAATINDMVAAAFVRAILSVGDWDGRMRLRLGMTVDLRRHYLNGMRAEGICNLSAYELLNFRHDPGADFPGTLARVVQRTRKRKASWIGLNSYIGMMPFLRLLPYSLLMRLVQWAFRAGMERRVVPNAISNMGPIERASVTFDAPAERAWILMPPVYPPMFAVGMTGYAGTLSFSAGIFPPSHRPETVERVFDVMLTELPR
jgi:NRPS condensation-like uncharacterized protein